MKHTGNKQGFTLVELIVVIVIIAILGTLAFLSFGQKSSYARDTLRKYDLGIINKIIWTRLNEWSMNPTEFLSTLSPSHTFSSGAVYNTPLDDTVYQVWTPNKPVFWNEAISDPVTGDPYIVAFTQWEFWAYYQVSATLETQRAIVEWAYYVWWSWDLEWIIKDPDWTWAILDNWEVTPY